jgi:hypothetical protein
MLSSLWASLSLSYRPPKSRRELWNTLYMCLYYPTNWEPQLQYRLMQNWKDCNVKQVIATDFIQLWRDIHWQLVSRQFVSTVTTGEEACLNKAHPHLSVAKVSMNSQLSHSSLTHYKKGIRFASWTSCVRLEHIHLSHFKRTIRWGNAEKGRGKVKKAE